MPSRCAPADWWWRTTQVRRRTGHAAPSCYRVPRCLHTQAGLALLATDAGRSPPPRPRAPRPPPPAVNQALLCTALGLPPAFFRRFAQSNAAFTVLDFDYVGGTVGEGGGQRQPLPPRVRVERMNQVGGWGPVALGIACSGRATRCKEQAQVGGAADALILVRILVKRRCGVPARPAMPACSAVLTSREACPCCGQMHTETKD